MFRLLFLPFLVILLFSCERESKEVDPLFYQISAEDSTRCMNEIVRDFLDQASKNQRIVDDFVDPNFQLCYTPRPILEIDVNTRGEIDVSICSDSCDLQEIVFEYFMFNRNLTASETLTASVNPRYPGFVFPFYIRYSSEEIHQKIKETQNELDDIKSVEGVDSLLVEYYASKVNEWKVKLIPIHLLGENEFSEIVSSGKVRVNYRKIEDRPEEVLKEIAMAFYQMRNYECIRYFKENYLNLYERAQRKKRKLDLEKLEALEVLHPISIFDHDRSKSPIEPEPALSPKK